MRPHTPYRLSSSLTPPALLCAGLKHIAMLALITFYRFAHQVLRNYNILRKFMVIKVVIFLNVVYVLAHPGPRAVAREKDG